MLHLKQCPECTSHNDREEDECSVCGYEGNNWKEPNQGYLRLIANIEKAVKANTGLKDSYSREETLEMISNK